MRSSIGRIDRPPRQGSQCQFGMGTTTVGMLRDVNEDARDWKSDAPVRKPGTITAALISGRRVGGGVDTVAGFWRDRHFV
mmetsp:Transcript_17545/g.25789  ORF Transcript_17545/g.25789 Transcript_17545/m.25789 type:complete len:80 (-) Transcript_17545:142-381(-)